MMMMSLPLSSLLSLPLSLVSVPAVSFLRQLCHIHATQTVHLVVGLVCCWKLGEGKGGEQDFLF